MGTRTRKPHQSKETILFGDSDHRAIRVYEMGGIYVKYGRRNAQPT